eukprot:scaffold164_cov340-Pinguiococcus_pyrenoidosus.AAC.5
MSASLRFTIYTQRLSVVFTSFTPKSIQSGSNVTAPPAPLDATVSVKVCDVGFMVPSTAPSGPQMGLEGPGKDAAAIRTVARTGMGAFGPKCATRDVSSPPLRRRKLGDTLRMSACFCGTLNSTQAGTRDSFLTRNARAVERPTNVGGMKKTPSGFASRMHTFGR